METIRVQKWDGIEIEEKGILERKEEKEREREIDSLKVFQEARTIEISN